MQITDLSLTSYLDLYSLRLLPEEWIAFQPRIYTMVAGATYELLVGIEQDLGLKIQSINVSPGAVVSEVSAKVSIIGEVPGEHAKIMLRHHCKLALDSACVRVAASVSKASVSSLLAGLS